MFMTGMNSYWRAQALQIHIFPKPPGPLCS
jgi:hypothetical protein